MESQCCNNKPKNLGSCGIINRIQLSLSLLIQQGVGNQLEFLTTVNNQKKLAQTICAFANTAGGSVLIGVKENGKITGIDPSTEFDVIQNAVERYCLPVVELDMKTWQEDRHLVLQISVAKGDDQVRCLSDDGSYKAYIRVGSDTILANKIIIGMWKFQQKEFPCPTEFSKETYLVIQWLAGSDWTSISQLYKKDELPKKLIDTILMQLLCWDVIQLVAKDGHLGYRKTTVNLLEL